MLNLPFWIPVLWLLGVPPSLLAFGLAARFRTGPVQARAAWARRRAVFWPVALPASLGAVLSLAYGRLLLCLVTTPADRHQATLAAAAASLRRAQRELADSEAACARVEEELRRQEAGETGSGALSAAGVLPGKAPVSGGGVSQAVRAWTLRSGWRRS